MKYRIQFSAVYDSANANAILNQIESQKHDVFDPTYYTEVQIIRKSKKLESDETKFESELTEYISVDFDASGSETHVHSISGIDEYLLIVDVSFDLIADFHTCINYLESVKANAFVDKHRNCRHFECKHEEQTNPLPNDGIYTYMDFTTAPLVYPL